MDERMDGEEGSGEEGEEVLAVLDAVIEVCFGYADDEFDELQRTHAWVDSFTPGNSLKQVADIHLSDGMFRVSLDRMEMSVPIEHLLELLGRAGVLNSTFLERSL